MATTRSLALAAAAAAVALVAAGCGDNGDSAAGGSDNGKIKIMVLGQFQAASFSLPEMETGAEAAVEAINKAGGVNGKKLELVSCNDQGDPNVAGQCARKAVAEHVVAVAGTITTFGDNVLPVLEAAGIAYVGALPLTPADFRSSVSFPMDGGNPANFGGEGIALVEHGCENVGIVFNSDNSATEVSVAQLEAGIKLAGGTVGKKVGVPASQPDYSPAVSTLIGSGAECVGIALPPAQSAQFVGAVRQSSKPTMLLANNVAVTPPALIAAGKGIMDGVLLTSSSYVPGTPEAPAEFQTDYKAVDTKGDGDLNAQNAWTSVHAIADIAEAIKGNVTASSFLAQAKKTSNLDMPAHPQPVDFTKENPAKEYPRLFNTKTLIYEVKDGKYSLTSSTPIDTQGALQ